MWAKVEAEKGGALTRIFQSKRQGLRKLAHNTGIITLPGTLFFLILQLNQDNIYESGRTYQLLAGQQRRRLA